MEQFQKKVILPIMVFSILLISVSANTVNAESVPEWVKNTALWYGQGIVSEQEFLNMIKFLIDNDVITIEDQKEISMKTDPTITIPNGNFNVSSTSFYLPLNLEIPVDTTVTWVNNDSVPHNIQSQDDSGKVIDMFNSPPLNTGDKFSYTFEEEGIFKYHCSWHPWRVGLVTVN
jgi:plastocyanin